jgi:hypothetical protein
MIRRNILTLSHVAGEEFKNLQEKQEVYVGCTGFEPVTPTLSR